MNSITRQCSVKYCSKKHYGKGYCEMHLARIRRGNPVGDAKLQRIINNDIDRFWSKVSKTDTCWLWKGGSVGGCPSNRYGQFTVGNSSIMAHRFSYLLCIGYIENEMDIDHLCRVRKCVNPKHLEPVTRRENVLRGDIVHSKKKELPVGVKRVGNRYSVEKSFAGKGVYIGTFGTPDEASDVYQTSIMN